MKVALIVPANLLHAPYINYYIRILKENKVKYDVINWNKLGIKEPIKGYTFEYKNRYETNVFNKITGYYLFSRFTKKIIRRKSYDKLIVFVPQLALFLNDMLKKEYNNKFILDIRDLGKANKYTKKLESIIEKSSYTVISSEGYKSWLPKGYKYILSHNTTVTDEDDFRFEANLDLKNKDRINISNIGVIRNFNENRKVIEAFKNKDRYHLNYIGQGVSEKELEQYSKDNNIENITFYGRYEKKDELLFFYKSDIINIITPKNKLGNHTAMANRFYNACIAKRPMIVTKGSYMAEIVENYNLGLAVDVEQEDIFERINHYIEQYDPDEFAHGCTEVLNKIVNDQIKFRTKVVDFITL